MMPTPNTSRRLFLSLVAAGGLAAATPWSGASASVRGATGRSAWLEQDEVAQTYHRVLLHHTRWSETQWNGNDRYRAADFGFGVVLGNAVLLTRGTYDADIAGISEATLRSRTIATIANYAKTNRLTGGSEWGRKLFWDSTFQTYFQLAARLLWDDLDEGTRSRIDAISREQAAYTAALGAGDDPASGSWTPNALLGGYRGDTKLEEMGVYAQALAPGLAWAGDDPRASEWREAFGRWSRNEAGLPPADLANPTLIDGVAVSENTAHNIHDTFLAENHGSFGPHYQSELWRTSGRNAIHFLMAGAPLPEVLTAQPNGDQLWDSLLSVMSDAGEPLMPLVDDREHLYGRDVIPLAFLSQVVGDRAAARAEADLAERLLPYLAYPPANRLAKFSGEPKYEPEARAEVAISFLLHEWSSHREAVEPLSAAEMFQLASGARDFGAGPGLLVHQSPGAWAGAVSKAGFVKLAWQPEHDNWLFNLGGGSPMFLPSTTVQVLGRFARAYTPARDGFDGSASLFSLATGRVGMTTLPSGSVVFSTSGTAADSGRFDVHNLTMAGVRGLTGTRHYSTAEGEFEVAAADASEALPPGVARRDVLELGGVTARHVRLLGSSPAPVYGYSVIALEARSTANGPDLARGRTTTASSQDPARPATLATDGSMATRWAVSREDRLRVDSWLAVDLGAPQAIDTITVYWEAAAGLAYQLQTSDDGSTWTDRASYPDARTTRGWLGVEDRFGFVVRDSANPIRVSGNSIVLSAGPASGSAGMVVEGHVGVGSGELSGLARARVPVSASSDVTTSLVEGHLSLFNLGTEAVSTTVEVPALSDGVTVFEGTQTLHADQVLLEVELPAATAAVLPPRAEVTDVLGRRPATGLVVDVVDAATVRLTGAAGVVRVRRTDGGSWRTVRVDASGWVVADLGGAPYPLADLAVGRTTFPTSPLPPGMSSPAAAVDGRADTVWTYPRNARMVVDLGAEVAVGRVVLDWAPGSIPAATLHTSADGITYGGATAVDHRGRTGSADLTGVTARYVALTLEATGPRWAGLERLSVMPPE
ncbi:discoidin domain-containing protein [Rothia sp. ARF10]|nr:discoidin domain-containing protein [Rothia sp. ARF10]